MKFIIDESLEGLIQRIAGPVEIICKDNTNYEVIGIPEDKKDVVRKAIKEYIEVRGKVFHDVD